MKEQMYIIEKNKSFNVKDIFECGQCFRWNKQQENSYTGVFNNNVINVKQEEDKIIFRGICEGDIKDICEEYFDLKTNYEDIKINLSNIDNYLKESIEYGEGIRILHQDLWETIISFIISANNNIPRIKKIIEKLSAEYGKKMIWNDVAYYSFPTPEDLRKASTQDLRRLGLGFRDVRVYETTKIINENKDILDELKREEDIKALRERLLTFPGVGPKVADCIMLFALKKFEVFPIDVWVKRVMNELYFKNTKKEPSNKELDKFAKERFGNLAGLAQQYLFYSRRTA